MRAVCGSEDTQVKDSRPGRTRPRSAGGGNARLRCPVHHLRAGAAQDLVVLKKDGKRLPFDRDKLARSIAIVFETGVDRSRSSVRQRHRPSHRDGG
jgi:transcriptional repressor NrdR